MPALLVGGALLVLIGGLGFARTEPVNDPPAPQTSGKLTLRAVAAATDRPIEGVSIEYRGRFDGKDRKRTAATGKDGLATIEYPAGIPIESFEITARKAGFAPICFVWHNERHPVAMPISKNLHFEPGATIGGIVQDEAGHPIAGARVERHGASDRVREREPRVLDRHRGDRCPGPLESGRRAEGPARRVRARDAPALHSAARRVRMAGPRRRDRPHPGADGDRAGRRCRRPAGQGARVQLGDNFGVSVPVGTTDDRGAFTLENCEAGATTVTVEAEGYAPRIQDMQVEGQAEPAVVALSERTATLRGRIVDVEGEPVAGAVIGADTWRKRRSLSFRATTGADGRFEWRRRPP